MFFRIFSLFLLVLTLANVFKPNQAQAQSETSNLSMINSVYCFNSNSKAFNNPNPVTGTKVNCEFYLGSNIEFEKFYGSKVNIRVGTAAQSPNCEKIDPSQTSISCKNIPIAGRASYQTIKINGKIVGKIKVENSIPNLTLNKIVHIDDQKDLKDPDHKYQLDISTKNFKTGVNGYRIIVYPKDLKNPIKSKISIQNYDESNIYSPKDQLSRSQLANNTNEICVVVARFNKILPKTKSCKSLPADEPNKQITSDIFSKALSCPEFVDVTKGQTTLKCTLNLPEGSMKYDENYYGTKDSMFYDLSDQSSYAVGNVKNYFDVDFLGEILGKCKLLDKEFTCEINSDKIKQNNLTLPFKGVVGVQFSNFGADMADYKIVKSIQIR